MKKMMIIVTIIVAMVMVVGGFSIKEELEKERKEAYASQLIEGTEYDTVVMYEDEEGITHYDVYDID